MPRPPESPAAPVGRQLILPLFPSEGTMLGEQMSVVQRSGSVWYFHYNMPVFNHSVEDVASFRMFTSQLCENGQCKLVDVQRAFGVSEISVKRAVKRYREGGVGAFFQSRQPQSHPRVLVPEILAQAQALLDEGVSVRETGRQLGVKEDTIRFAIRDGRLHRAAPQKKVPARNPPK